MLKDILDSLKGTDDADGLGRLSDLDVDRWVDGLHGDGVDGDEEPKKPIKSPELAADLSNVKISTIREGLRLVPLLVRLIQYGYPGTATVALIAAQGIFRQIATLAAEADTDAENPPNTREALRKIMDAAKANEYMTTDSPLTTTVSYFELKAQLKNG